MIFFDAVTGAYKLHFFPRSTMKNSIPVSSSSSKFKFVASRYISAAALSLVESTLGL